MSNRYTVHLELTPKQAVAMLFAVRNWTDDDDVMQSVFADKSEREACYRAAEKLQEAINCLPRAAFESEAVARRVEELNNAADREGDDAGDFAGA